ncbi:cell division protein FtsL [Salibacterium halotolerans]|uniref:Cell division protein FtsL n=1 Tax=Salibacterium halotolerans TaxID=1884432 RepID=A0A1I5M466_9BACI|nr:cell division protein FtsL [Salibacterium halotolerans]SFP04362.1 cell division protein FtsL [Salibacterium halotolerans]
MDNLARKMQKQQQTERTVHKEIRTHHVPGKVTKGEKVIVMAMLAAFVAACVILISNYAGIYVQQQEIAGLNQSISEQTETNQSLEQEIAELSAPERIMHYAKDELGMELNDKQVKVIQGSGS